MRSRSASTSRLDGVVTPVFLAGPGFIGSPHRFFKTTATAKANSPGTKIRKTSAERNVRTPRFVSIGLDYRMQNRSRIKRIDVEKNGPPGGRSRQPIESHREFPSKTSAFRP